MNTRINILYFIESLCDQSLAASYTSYIKMIQRDLSLIIDAVAPDDQVGAANAETARKVRQTSLLPIPPGDTSSPTAAEGC
jgi:CTD kinase subunit gamma